MLTGSAQLMNPPPLGLPPSPQLWPCCCLCCPGGGVARPQPGEAPSAPGRCVPPAPPAALGLAAPSLSAGEVTEGSFPSALVVPGWLGVRGPPQQCTRHRQLPAQRQESPGLGAESGQVWAELALRRPGGSIPAPCQVFRSGAILAFQASESVPATSACVGACVPSLKGRAGPVDVGPP